MMPLTSAKSEGCVSRNARSLIWDPALAALLIIPTGLWLFGRFYKTLGVIGHREQQYWAMGIVVLGGWVVPAIQWAMGRSWTQTLTPSQRRGGSIERIVVMGIVLCFLWSLKDKTMTSLLLFCFGVR
jgi:hypothetical protein